MFRREVGVVSIALLCIAIFASGAAQSATLDCFHTKYRKEELSRHTIKPGDRPDREMVLISAIDVWSSNNPDLDGIEETLYIHLDHVGATGVHSGYTQIPVKTGETVWLKFDGTHNLVTKGDTWELPYHGVFRFIAGTGKYKAIRGGGSYDGLVNESGLFETTNCSAEY